MDATPSNRACSYYDPVLLLPPPPPDTDHDGIPDAIDECLYEYGEFPHGCPDLDRDSVPDKDDKCPQQWGEKPDGCPFKYALRFMGMKILNNSIDANSIAHSPDPAFTGEFFHIPALLVVKSRGLPNSLVIRQPFPHGGSSGAPTI
jgi:hypothetical protein